MASWQRQFTTFGVALLASCIAGIAAATTASEYQIKAAFLFNFSHFVAWPSTAFSTPDEPLVIGVLGMDPFGTALDDIVRGETINGRPIVVRRFRQVQDVQNCQILFVSGSERDQLEPILNHLKGHSILTVSDVDGFARNGGMIRFVMADNRTRLHINLAAARAANLTISSNLLRPAQVVAAGED